MIQVGNDEDLIKSVSEGYGGEGKYKSFSYWCQYSMIRADVMINNEQISPGFQSWCNESDHGLSG